MSTYECSKLDRKILKASIRGGLSACQKIMDDCRDSGYDNEEHENYHIFVAAWDGEGCLESLFNHLNRLDEQDGKG